MRVDVPGRVTLLLAVFLTVALGASACGDGDPPAVTVVPTVAAATRSPSPTPSPVETVTQTAEAATPAATEVSPPTEGRWIDVDVTQFVVRLMEGAEVVEAIEPVGVGLQIDTGAYESTQTGLFYVYVKRAGLSYDAPYDTYIDWWVGFDPDKANGFHSFLLDEHGGVVDDSTGRVSNGCIRSGEAEAIFEFAEVGMPVLVHA